MPKTSSIAAHTAFGLILRRYRIMRGMKQQSLADLFGVRQSTMSKWEQGTLYISEERQAQIMDLISVYPSWIADSWLRRLVETSSQRVHVICDVSHRLLAASPSRVAEWGVTSRELIGQKLLQDAPDDIVAAEKHLLQGGAGENYLRPMIISTAGQRSGRYKVEPGRLLWEKLQIEDGSWVRLVTDLDPSTAAIGAVHLTAPR